MTRILAALAFATLLSSPSAFALNRAQIHTAKSDILKDINRQTPGFKGSLENVTLGAARGDLLKFTATENALWGGAFKTTGTYDTKTTKIVRSTTTETN